MIGRGYIRTFSVYIKSAVSKFQKLSIEYIHKYLVETEPNYVNIEHTPYQQLINLKGLTVVKRVTALYLTNNGNYIQ